MTSLNNRFDIENNDKTANRNCSGNSCLSNSSLKPIVCNHPIGKNKCIRLANGFCSNFMSCMFNDIFWEEQNKMAQQNMDNLLRKIAGYGKDSEKWLHETHKEAVKFRQEKREIISEKIDSNIELSDDEKMFLEFRGQKDGRRKTKLQRAS